MAGIAAISQLSLFKGTVNRICFLPRKDKVTVVTTSELTHRACRPVHCVNV